MSMWNDVCSKSGQSDALIVSRLKYLTESTARRHLFVVGKGHTKVFGRYCDPWWAKPNSQLL